MKLRAALLFAAIAAASTIILDGSKMDAQEQPPKPPVAKKVPKTTQIHGYTVTDDYAWLRDDKRESTDVVNYLKAENDYADAMTRSQQGFRDALYTEMLGRIKEYYSTNQNAKNSIISEIKEDKAISFLIDHAVVTEVDAEHLKAA